MSRIASFSATLRMSERIYGVISNAACMRGSRVSKTADMRVQIKDHVVLGVSIDNDPERSVLRHRSEYSLAVETEERRFTCNGI